MRNLSYAEIVELYTQCHGPRVRDISAMAWALHMEQMLGPDDPNDLKGFLIRSPEKHFSGMFLTADGMSWCGVPFWPAKQWTWAETAVKITNNPKLEAIRINGLGIAIDSKGRTVATLT